MTETKGSFLVLLEALGRGEGLNDLLQMVARTIEAELANARVSVLLLDSAGKSLRLAAAPSLPAELIEASDGIMVHTGEGAMGAVDIARDPSWARFRERARHHGIKACWSEAITLPGGAIAGTLAAYVGEARGPVPAEWARLKEGAQIVALALQRDSAERQQRAAERRFRDFTSAAGDWLWEADAEGRLTYISQRFTDVTGIPLERVIRRTVFEPELIRPDAHYTEILRRLRLRLPFRNMMLEMRRPDGGATFASISGVPVYEDDGGFAGYRGTGSDLTARIEAENRANIANSVLRMAMEVVPDGFLLLDENECLVLANRTALEMYPSTRRLMVPGARLEDMTTAAVTSGDVAVDGVDDKDQVIQIILQRIRAGTGDPRYLKVAGGRWVRASEHRIKGGGRVLIRTDITALLLHEEELRRARDRAEDANRAKSIFLANISHELRTPLNAINGFSEIISEKLFGENVDALERYADYARDINLSGQHLLALINDLLDLTKIEAGEVRLQEEVIDLERLLSTCTKLVREQADKAGVTLLAECLAEGVALRADTRMIRQILLNLVTNAIKFSGAGKKVALSFTRGKDGGMVLIVKDEGIGMNPADIPTVMLPFGKLDNPMQANHNGVGLGLPLVKSLAELHGARLELISAEGEGTTATVYFPTHRCVAVRE
ncbi:ATP-binding protein [Lacibacterium aquatile]|uniref:histidine kinase n=1 Tax=Lacibacterium aquatile TaxID=1168082 RepID=A0ABW5DLL2_9PROT